MSCLSKVGCLTVVAVIGAGAWWMYGGSLPSFVIRNGRPTLGAPASTGSASRPVAWSTIKDARIPSTEAIASLESRSGPAYITLGAGDLAGFLAEGLGRVLPQSASAVQVAIVDDLLRVRSEIPLRELGGKALPEFVSDMLTARDTVEMAGTLEMVHPGLAQFRVREVIVRGVALPPRVVPPLLASLRKSVPNRDSIASDGVALALPRSVADVAGFARASHVVQISSLEIIAPTWHHRPPPHPPRQHRHFPRCAFLSSMTNREFGTR